MCFSAMLQSIFKSVDNCINCVLASTKIMAPRGKGEGGHSGVQLNLFQATIHSGDMID